MTEYFEIQEQIRKLTGLQDERRSDVASSTSNRQDYEKELDAMLEKNGASNNNN